MKHKTFATLGVITVVSGLLLIYQGSYIPGVGGTIVGISLTADNINKMREK